MLISFDTNIWIFGITQVKPSCTLILEHLARFTLLIPNQVRLEVKRNLPIDDYHYFHQLINKVFCQIDYAPIPSYLIAEFQRKGLKKGDAVIGAFCEWRNINIFVSDNRDFLRGLAPEHSFQVLSPAQICKLMALS